MFNELKNSGELIQQENIDKMENLKKKWNKLMKIRDSNESVQIGCIRPTKLNIKTIEHQNCDNKNIESRESSSGILSNTIDYEISQSSSKIFSPKSTSYTSELNIILTKELTPETEMPSKDKTLSSHEIKKIVNEISSHSLQASNEKNEKSTKTAEPSEEMEKIEADDILNIIQNHAENIEFKELMPTGDEHVKIVAMTQDKSAKVNLVESSFNEDAMKNSGKTSDLENIEMVSNDLFDWLLWIDHTINSQVFIYYFNMFI